MVYNYLLHAQLCLDMHCLLKSMFYKLLEKGPTGDLLRTAVTHPVRSLVDVKHVQENSLI